MIRFRILPNPVAAKHGVTQLPGLRFGKEKVFGEVTLSKDPANVQQAAELIVDLRIKPKSEYSRTQKIDQIKQELIKILAAPKTTLAVIHNSFGQLSAVGLFEPDHLVVSRTPSSRYGLVSDIYIADPGKKLGQQVLLKLYEYAKQQGFAKLLVEANSPQVHQLAKDLEFSDVVPGEAVYPNIPEEKQPVYLLKSLDGQPVPLEEQQMMQLRIGCLGDMRRFIYQPRDHYKALWQDWMQHVRRTFPYVKKLESLFQASS